MKTGEIVLVGGSVNVWRNAEFYSDEGQEPERGKGKKRERTEGKARNEDEKGGKQRKKRKIEVNSGGFGGCVGQRPVS